MNCNPVTIGEAVSAAWKRMVQVLFHPFDLTKWITWGFCIWVISCSSGKSGGSGNFPTGKTHSSGTVHSGGADSFWPKLDQLLNGTDGSFFDRMCRTFHWEPATVTLVLSLIAVLVLFGIAIAVVLLWLRGRFEFMWLHNTVRNRAEIKAPWREYRREGNSFFKGWFLISLMFVLASLLMMISVLLPFFRWIKASAAAHEALPFHFQELLIGGAVYVLAIVLIGLYLWLAGTFVPPIMYRRRCGFSEGLHLFNRFLRQAPGQFIKFILMHTLIFLLFGIAIVSAVCLTCCILAIPLMIPFVGTVVLLPIHVFDRYFSLEFLARLTPEFDLFPPPEPVAGPAMTEPPLIEEATQDQQEEK